MGRTFLELLTHPLVRGVPIDDPSAIPMRRELIRRRGFLRRVYEARYRSIVSQVPSGRAPVLALGSGPSFTFPVW